MKDQMAAEVDRLSNRYSDPSIEFPRSDVRRLIDAIVHTTGKLDEGTKQIGIPAGYLSLRHVETLLDRRMWANFGCAKLAGQYMRNTRHARKHSPGFGPRRDRVAESLKAAFVAGKLGLYVAADGIKVAQRLGETSSWIKEPIALPKELIGHVFVKHGMGRLPATFAIRPSRTIVGNDKIHSILNCGPLVVRESELGRWLRSEHGKRRWPSQTSHTSPKRRAVGRPSKLDGRLRIAVLEIARQQTWNGERRPITELQRLLSGRGLDVPSADTVGRIVDMLFAETGESEFRRRHRVRRR